MSLLNSTLLPETYSTLNGCYLDLISQWQWNGPLLYLVVTFLAHEIVFVPFNLFLGFLNRFKIPFFEKYRLQPGREPSQRLYEESMKEVVITHLIAQPVVSFALGYLWLFMGHLKIHEDLPGIVEVVAHLLAFLVINDTLFYFSHRLMHVVPWLYKNIHSVHHRFITPIGISAEYAHPAEGIISNVIPTFGALFFFKIHLVTVAIWLLLRVLETVDAHSGFAFPWSPFAFSGVFLGARGHDWHHSHNKGNFGMLAFWDRVLGTDIGFREFLRKPQQKAE